MPLSCSSCMRDSKPVAKRPLWHLSPSRFKRPSACSTPLTVPKQWPPLSPNIPQVCTYVLMYPPQPAPEDPPATATRPRKINATASSHPRRRLSCIAATSGVASAATGWATSPTSVPALSFGACSCASRVCSFPDVKAPSWTGWNRISPPAPLSSFTPTCSTSFPGPLSPADRPRYCRRPRPFDEA